MTGGYDAVVVGAGPAGSTAAAYLARRGISVLLLEAKNLPRHKPCGGGLTGRARRYLHVPVDDLVLGRAGSVQIRLGTRSSALIRSTGTEMWFVRRSDLDQRLAEDAVRQGAILHEGEPVVGVDVDGAVRVRSERGSYTARVLIGADGAESKVARWLGFDRPRRWMVALETETTDSRGARCSDAVIDLSIPGGYAWLFPRGASCDVGAGTFYPGAARGLRERLERFAEEEGFRLEGFRARGHRIPTGLIPGPLHRGAAVLVGDAAAVADPLFGEGISYSLLSGQLAAESVAAFLRGEAPGLDGYTARLKRLLARDARAWRVTAAFVYRFPALALRLLAASRTLQCQVERTIAGEVSLARP